MEKDLSLLLLLLIVYFFVCFVVVVVGWLSCLVLFVCFCFIFALFGLPVFPY